MNWMVNGSVSMVCVVLSLLLRGQSVYAEEVNGRQKVVNPTGAAANRAGVNTPKPVVSVELDVGNGNGGEPDGDVDINNREDGTYTYVPGCRGSKNVIEWKTGALTAQHLKLVATAPGATKVQFERVSVSKIMGFCANSIMPDASMPDYSFDSSCDPSSADVSWVQEPVRNGKAIADFYCKDYGGKCSVLVTFKDENNATIGTLTLNVPRDDDNDGLADQWEEDAVREWDIQYLDTVEANNAFFEQSSDKEKKAPDGASGVAHKTTGDGLTAWEEYRGFWFDGPTGWGGTVGFLRLSPAKKNMLIEVENMAGFTGVATQNEVKDALTIAKTVFLRDAGVQVDFAVDNVAAVYCKFQSESDSLTYRTSHRDHDNSRRPSASYIALSYMRFWYVIFCEAHYGDSGALGVANDNMIGANVYSSSIRQHMAEISCLNLGITYNKYLGYVLTHELGHCAQAQDHVLSVDAMSVSFSPLTNGKTVEIRRSRNELKFDVSPSDADKYSCSLLAVGAQTFNALKNVLPGGQPGRYNGMIQGSSGPLYTITICNATPLEIGEWSPAMIHRASDVSLMEAYTVVQPGTPVFATSGQGYQTEVSIMDFTKLPR